MKKKILTILTTFLFISQIFSFEWGGLLTENFKFTTQTFQDVENISFRQSNGISLWANIPFTNNGSWYLSSQASYKYNYDFVGFTKGNYNNLQNIFDVDLFKLNGLIKLSESSIALSFGRYFVFDNTSKVFAQNCDGLSFKYNGQVVNFGIYAGYTGLVNGNNVITLAKDGSYEYEPQDFYGKTHPYVPLSLTLTFPSIIFNQSLGLQANAFLDLGTEKYNRLYGTLTLQGPIFWPVYYSFNSCFGIENYSDVSNLSILSFMVFIKSFTAKINCEYASGEQLVFKPFKGFNSSAAFVSSMNPEYSGLLLPGATFIFGIKDFYVELDGKCVMLYPKDKLIIQGFSVGLKSITNIYSDVAIDLSMNFYDNFHKDSEYSQLTGSQYFTCSIELSIAF